MTTNITQLAIDLAALAGGRGNPDDLRPGPTSGRNDLPVRR
jgi:hypothetical protein